MLKKRPVALVHVHALLGLIVLMLLNVTYTLFYNL